MFKEPAGHTLQPTALVHEAWLRLGADNQPAWKNRAHFFAAAAEAMRRILIERTRRRVAIRRGGGVQPLDADELEIPSPTSDDDKLLRVNDALEKLASQAAGYRRSVDCHRLAHWLTLALIAPVPAPSMPAASAPAAPPIGAPRRR